MATAGRRGTNELRTTEGLNQGGRLNARKAFACGDRTHVGLPIAGKGYDQRRGLEYNSIPLLRLASLQAAISARMPLGAAWDSRGGLRPIAFCLPENFALL
jgi:hypothetical protein